MPIVLIAVLLAPKVPSEPRPQKRHWLMEGGTEWMGSP